MEPLLEGSNLRREGAGDRYHDPIKGQEYILVAVEVQEGDDEELVGWAAFCLEDGVQWVGISDTPEEATQELVRIY